MGLGLYSPVEVMAGLDSTGGCGCQSNEDMGLPWNR